MIDRPFRDLCPSADDRDAMSDDDFWATVLDQPAELFDDSTPDSNVTQLDPTPCPVCGEPGACSYDSEGRPLIHTTGEDDDD